MFVYLPSPHASHSSWPGSQLVTSKKLQFLCYPLPSLGELRFEIKLLPASLVSFGKTHLSCNGPAPVGIGSPWAALGVTLWRSYFYSIYKISALAALSAWVQETVNKREGNYDFSLVHPHVVSFSFTFPYPMEVWTPALFILTIDV